MYRDPFRILVYCFEYVPYFKVTCFTYKSLFIILHVRNTHTHTHTHVSILSLKYIHSTQVLENFGLDNLLVLEEGDATTASSGAEAPVSVCWLGHAHVLTLHTYIHAHTYVHTCACTYIPACIHTCMHLHYTYIHVFTYIHAHVNKLHIHAYKNTFTCADTCMRVNIYYM